MKPSDIHLQKNGAIYISDTEPMTIDRLIDSLQTIRDHIGSDFKVVFFGSVDQNDSNHIADYFANGKERVHLVMRCCTVLYNPTAEEGSASHNVVVVANSSVVDASNLRVSDSDDDDLPITDHEKGDGENED